MFPLVFSNTSLCFAEVRGCDMLSYAESRKPPRTPSSLHSCVSKMKNI
ncbi:hypothetical protein M3J09_012207 [Ascochyta lentis]